MASNLLQGMRVAILATDDFEQSEMTEPKKALDQAGAKTFIVSPKSGEIQGMKHDEKADRFPVDLLLAEADPEQFDAALLPGGALSADTFAPYLRQRLSLVPLTGAENPLPSSATGRGCSFPQDWSVDGR
jgi:deglycase